MNDEFSKALDNIQDVNDDSRKRNNEVYIYIYLYIIFIISSHRFYGELVSADNVDICMDDACWLT